jgi:1-aminocyclopropane-1-carboxylate deaminase
MLRLDLLDPAISGNKLFKLLPNLEAARQAGLGKLLSFGGAWSNHLHALAAAGHRFGFDTIGVVRGEPGTELNPCQQDAVAWGMHLHFISRADYRHKHEPGFLEALQQQFGPCFIIPEGGANLQGIIGCQRIIHPGLCANFSHVLVACGTGTTMCGVVTATPLPVTGIQALRGAGYLQREISRMLAMHDLQVCSPHWEVLDSFHRGGFARSDPDLEQFMIGFTATTGIPLEPVYSGKMMLALRTLLDTGYYPAGSRILALHGGGLQGGRGFAPDPLPA